MSKLPWQTLLTVQGMDVETNKPVPVAVGLLQTEAGGIQVALQVGEDRPVTLPLQEANQLAVNVTETTAARLRITADKLGDE